MNLRSWLTLLVTKLKENKCWSGILWAQPVFWRVPYCKYALEDSLEAINCGLI